MKEEAYAVFDEKGQLLTKDPEGQGLGWKYPAIFASRRNAEMFVSSHAHRGQFEVKPIVITLKKNR